jgi:hypothetical protein
MQRWLFYDFGRISGSGAGSRAAARGRTSRQADASHESARIHHEGSRKAGDAARSRMAVSCTSGYGQAQSAGTLDFCTTHAIAAPGLSQGHQKAHGYDDDREAFEELLLLFCQGLHAGKIALFVFMNLLIFRLQDYLLET